MFSGSPSANHNHSARFKSLSNKSALTVCSLLFGCAAVFVLTGAVERESASVDVGLSLIEPSTFRLVVERHGVVEPFSSTPVHSECYWSTNILSIVPEGTWVQEGDVVCVMDSADIEDYARSREVLLIKYRGRLDNALHEETMLASQSERLLGAAEYKYETADQELSEYQGGTLPQQLEDMERNLSMLSEQTHSAADEVRQTERLWSMGLISGQEMYRESLDYMVVQQKFDQLDASRNLLINFANPRKSLQLEFTRNNALRNVARTKIKNSLAQTKARLTTLTYERSMRIYERYYRLATDSVKACTLLAPCDGQVMYGNSWYLKSRGITQIEEGSKVRRQQKVFEIPDRDRVKVSVPVDEALIYRIEQGMPVTVVPQSYEDVEIAGRIVRIAKYPRVRSSYTPSVKDYWLDIELLPTPEQSEVLKLKADVDVQITLAEIPDALQIPRETITGVAGHNFVYVFENNELVPRAVELGEANEEFVCVDAGLTEGDQLVTEMTPQHREKLVETLSADLGAATE